MTARVTIVEVGPRDGFQAEAEFIPTATKIAVVDAIAAAGVPVIEVTSFVSPKAVPQLADAAEVMKGITRRPSTQYIALVPNLTGAERAIAAGTDAVKCVLSATDAGNLKNVGRSVEESIAEVERIAGRTKATATAVHAVIGLAFGCPFTGAVRPDRVVAIASRLANLGVREIAVADSYGYAGPVQVSRLCALLIEALPGVSLALHLHNTRGMAVANAYAGWQMGITRFESSIGGLGGALIAPGATGNIASEDLVHLLHEMGVATGVDLDLLMNASRLVQDCVRRTLPSRVLQAGTAEAALRAARQ